MATRGPFAATATTRPMWHRCGRHHHHHHRAHGKTFSTGLERTMCTKAASSKDTTTNKTTTTTTTATTPQEQWKASIDFKAIRENQKHVERNCANRNVAVDVSAGRNLMTFLRDATHRI